MATTTFDKTIVLNPDAANILADTLDQPALPLPSDDDEFWDENRKKVKAWLLPSTS